MRLISCKDYHQVCAAAASITIGQVWVKPNSVLGLPTGSTPLGMYELLKEKYQKGEADFSRVTTFNLDEYYPIPRGDAQSYYTFMHQNLFSGINVPAERIHILNGEAKDPAAECAAYEEKIAKAGGIDLQVLGIGQNGHIGFNEPGDYLESSTHMTDLTENTISANARFFASAGDVPKKSLTMGVGTILKSKKIIILISGAQKKHALQSLLAGKITTQNPSTLLLAHPDVTVIADEAALV